jgi:outer membrane protein OmpA-like peptidoglycan-associated protein
MRRSYVFGKEISLLVIASMVIVPGCVATRDWVETWVPEQLFPINKRVSDNEANIAQTGQRVSNVEGRVASVDDRVEQMAKQIADLEARLGQTTAKADRALDGIQRLKLDRKLVLDFKEGAFFSSNSTVLTNQAKKEIDGFLSDLKGEADGTSGVVFVLAGHTDNVGNERLNYRLARLRAENAADYLTTAKKIDPSRLFTISYGETAPVADNATGAGRAKNRRVEILVYKDTISVGSGGVAPGTK